jgi:hypothetical protein
VQRLARNEISPEQLTIVVVGDAKKIREGLSSIAPVTMVADEPKPTTAPAHAE